MVLLSHKLQDGKIDFLQVVSCGAYWIRCEQCLPIDMISESLRTSVTKFGFRQELSTFTPTINENVIVQDLDSVFYRGVIKTCTQQIYQVRLIDACKDIKISGDCVFPYFEPTCDFKEQAHLVGLHSFIPMTIHQTPNLIDNEKQQINTIRQIITRKNFEYAFKTVCYIDNIPFGKIKCIDTDSNSVYSLSEILVDNKIGSLSQDFNQGVISHHFNSDLLPKQELENPVQLDTKEDDRSTKIMEKEGIHVNPQRSVFLNALVDGQIINPSAIARAIANVPRVSLDPLLQFCESLKRNPLTRNKVDKSLNHVDSDNRMEVTLDSIVTEPISSTKNNEKCDVPVVTRDSKDDKHTDKAPLDQTQNPSALCTSQGFGRGKLMRLFKSSHFGAPKVSDADSELPKRIQDSEINPLITEQIRNLNVHDDNSNKDDKDVLSNIQNFESQRELDDNQHSHKSTSEIVSTNHQNMEMSTSVISDTKKPISLPVNSMAKNGESGLIRAKGPIHFDPIEFQSSDDDAGKSNSDENENLDTVVDVVSDKAISPSSIIHQGVKHFDTIIVDSFEDHSERSTSKKNEILEIVVEGVTDKATDSISPSRILSQGVKHFDPIEFDSSDDDACRSNSGENETLGTVVVGVTDNAIDSISSLSLIRQDVKDFDLIEFDSSDNDAGRSNINKNETLEIVVEGVTDKATDSISPSTIIRQGIKHFDPIEFGSSEDHSGRSNSPENETFETVVECFTDKATDSISPSSIIRQDVKHFHPLEFDSSGDDAGRSSSDENEILTTVVNDVSDKSTFKAFDLIQSVKCNDKVKSLSLLENELFLQGVGNVVCGENTANRVDGEPDPSKSVSFNWKPDTSNEYDKFLEGGVDITKYGDISLIQETLKSNSTEENKTLGNETSAYKSRGDLLDSSDDDLLFAGQKYCAPRLVEEYAPDSAKKKSSMLSGLISNENIEKEIQKTTKFDAGTFESMKKTGGLLLDNNTTIPNTPMGKIEEIKDESKQNPSFCLNMLQFGRCWNRENCVYQHVISIQRDKPQNIPTEGFVKLKILYVHDATHYLARLLFHSPRLDTTISDEPESDKFQSNIDRINFDLINHFNDRNNRHLHGRPKIGDLVAVESKSNTTFLRAKIIKITAWSPESNPLQVLVLLIDIGTNMNPMVDELYELPTFIQQHPPRSVDIFLSNLQPLEVDNTWSFESKDVIVQAMVEASLNQKRGAFFVGKIMLTIGSSIIVNDCRYYEKVNNSYVAKLSLRDLLLEAKCAQRSPNHTKVLNNLCVDANLINPGQEGRQVDPTKLQSVNSDWAYLPDDVLVNVTMSLVVDPSLFFVTQILFNDRLAQMHLDLKEEMNQKSSPLGIVEVGSLCAVKYPDNQNNWNRGSVVKLLDGNKVEVFCVDYGDKIIAAVEDLFSLPNEFIARLPFQAIECGLCGVASMGEFWSDADIETFNAVTTNPLLLKVCKISPTAVVTEGCHYEVILMDAANPALEKSLNKSMVFKGCANWDPKTKHYLNNAPNTFQALLESQEKTILDRNSRDTSDNGVDKGNECLEEMGKFYVIDPGNVNSIHIDSSISNIGTCAINETVKRDLIELEQLDVVGNQSSVAQLIRLLGIPDITGEDPLLSSLVPGEEEAKISDKPPQLKIAPLDAQDI